MAEYIWGTPDDDVLPKSWGMVDFKKSSFGEWRLRSIQPNTDYGEAIVNFKRWSLEKLSKWHCPPAVAGLLISPALRQVVRRFADEEDLLFYPVNLVCKDGLNKDYQYLAPRHEVSCIDFDKSVPALDRHSYTLGYISSGQKIYFRENCLGNRHIAWEAKLSMKIVVSEALKEAVLELNDPGIDFILPQNYNWI